MTLGEMTDYLRECRRRAAGIIDSGREHMPMVHLFRRGRVEILVLTSMEEVMKMGLAAMIRDLTRSGEVDGVVFVSESWMVRSSGEKELADLQQWRETHASLEEHPNRVEMLVMEGAVPTGVVRNYYDITGTGASRHLGEVSLDSIDMVSRFTSGLEWPTGRA